MRLLENPGSAPVGLNDARIGNFGQCLSLSAAEDNRRKQSFTSQRSETIARGKAAVSTPVKQKTQEARLTSVLTNKQSRDGAAGLLSTLD